MKISNLKSKEFKVSEGKKAEQKSQPYSSYQPMLMTKSVFEKHPADRKR